MKTLLILSIILCAALSVRAATEVDVDTTVSDQAAALPQGKKITECTFTVTQEAAAAGNSTRFQFCLDGWLHFRGKCYYLHNNPDTWTNAERYCGNYGGSLASVHNIWEYNFLQGTVKNGGHTFAWIGGYFFQDDWRWEDGSLFDYHNWETAASSDHYQCLQLNSQGSKGWSNHGCSMPFPFVCQVKPDC
uniref:C-type lectin domain-containing protein n=1 Tax=Dicentrarchus labrax TaxID=13489 RepID=A0A8P4G455_DICLA